jgi:hypothetical protein
MQLTEQEIVRRDNLQKIKELGIDPFPPEAFPVDTFAKEVEEGFDPEEKKLPGCLHGWKDHDEKSDGESFFC